MLKIINENIQMIHIGPTTRLTSTSILYALQRARSSRTYAKFYTDKYYIQVNYMRDGTVNVASNITNCAFNNDLRRLDRQGWNDSRAKEFIYRWLQINRKTVLR